MVAHLPHRRSPTRAKTRRSWIARSGTRRPGASTGTRTSSTSCAPGSPGSGGIYSGLARDYDDPRVHPVAIKWLPSLTKEQRAAIVTAATAIQSEGYHYDVPGLAPGAPPAPDPDSGPRGQTPPVLQRVLPESIPGRARKEGGLHGPGRDEDTTPDDLWYSPWGKATGSNNPFSRGRFYLGAVV